MALRREVAGRAFLDAGCGAGILGMGLLLMGARVAYFLDQDEQAMQICKDNYISLKKEYEIGEANFMVHDIQLFDGEVDIVAQNPPFGTKNEHADRKFLEKAFEVASVVYSMHKYSTKSFVEAMCKDYKFKITQVWKYEFPLKKTFAFHRKPVTTVEVGLWRMEQT